MSAASVSPRPEAEPGPSPRTVVVSPHLDDAVLSCGDLIWQIPGCVVVTVFAGGDVDWSETHPWDVACGFGIGADVTAARTEEDEHALAQLGARGVRLAFLDEQYRDAGISPSPEVLSRAIEEAVSDLDAQIVLFPLGLHHLDHRLTAAGVSLLARREPFGQRVWIAYQELPYAYEFGEEQDQALKSLCDLRPCRVAPTRSDQDRKARAIDHYRSQLRALGPERRTLALGPEGYWLLGGDRERAELPAWLR